MTEPGDEIRYDHGEEHEAERNRGFLAKAHLARADGAAEFHAIREQFVENRRRPSRKTDQQKLSGKTVKHEIPRVQPGRRVAPDTPGKQETQKTSLIRSKLVS